MSKIELLHIKQLSDDDRIIVEYYWLGDCESNELIIICNHYALGRQTRMCGTNFNNLRVEVNPI